MSPLSTNDLDKITATIALAMKDGFSALTAALQPRAMASQARTYRQTSSRFIPKGGRASPSDLADKDRQIVAAFARRGFKVTLMDRSDPKLPYDVRPYKGWLEVGRVVRKGQHGVKGLFHVTMTDAITPPAPPKGKKAKLTLRPVS